MKRFVLDYVNKFEGYKTAIKSLHWNSKNLSQHKLCDEIAEEIAEFQDTVSEVEQSIGGNLSFNKLKGTEYKITDVKKFLKDVISETISFYKELQNKGDKYIGLRSECESFLTKMQRFIYLVDFTLKEDFKRNYEKKLNESFEAQECGDDGDEQMVSDAKEAIEMSDGQISFDEWAPAYEGEDEEDLRSIWNQACDETTHQELKESKNGKTLKLTENALYGYIQEAMSNVIGKFINEDTNCEAEVKGGQYNDKELNFTHFAVNKETKLIVDGWDYSGEDTTDLSSDKNYYFFDDLKNNGFNPKAFKILSFNGCQRQGINPNDKSTWSNTGLFPVMKEAEMQKQGTNPFEMAQQEHPEWYV